MSYKSPYLFTKYSIHFTEINETTSFRASSRNSEKNQKVRPVLANVFDLEDGSDRAEADGSNKIQPRLHLLQPFFPLSKQKRSFQRERKNLGLLSFVCIRSQDFVSLHFHSRRYSANSIFKHPRIWSEGQQQFFFAEKLGCFFGRWRFQWAGFETLHTQASLASSPVILNKSSLKK